MQLPNTPRPEFFDDVRREYRPGSEAMTTDEAREITIYSDGGCQPNPGRGAWAAVLLREGLQPVELVGTEDETTNNRMELRAALEALKSLDAEHRVTLFTDSVYMRRGMTEWMALWKKTGWKTRSGEAVKNRDLWEVLDSLVSKHEISWHWVKGHAGNKWNERVDALARHAIGRNPLPLDQEDCVHAFLAVSYSMKQKAGAYGITLIFGKHRKGLSGRVENASANEMHIHSALEALSAVKKCVPIYVYTTSDYLEHGATQWISTWKRRGWVTREDRPVSHRELWQSIDPLLASSDISWFVVPRDEIPDAMAEAKALSRKTLDGLCEEP